MVLLVDAQTLKHREAGWAGGPPGDDALGAGFGLSGRRSIFSRAGVLPHLAPALRLRTALASRSPEMERRA